MNQEYSRQCPGFARKIINDVLYTGSNVHLLPANARVEISSKARFGLPHGEDFFCVGEIIFGFIDISIAVEEYDAAMIH